MNPDERKIIFRVREFKGSRLRCLLVTSQDNETVNQFADSVHFKRQQTSKCNRIGTVS
jgi:hypothetical protein